VRLPSGTWRTSPANAAHPRNVTPADAGAHGTIKRENLSGTTDLEDVQLLHRTGQGTIHEQADIPVDTRMREHDGCGRGKGLGMNAFLAVQYAALLRPTDRDSH